MELLTLVLEGRADRALLGGKGAAIDRLIAAGYPVPPTGVLTTAAYRTFVADGALCTFVEQLCLSPDTDAPSASEIDAAFLAAPMPAGLSADITELGREIGRGAPVAVRSSATTEDLRAASFAGQYRSLLNVNGSGDLERAVRLIWASLWHPAPRAYRRFRGIAEDDLAMAVIVMRMVPAVLAGVVFTEDPGGEPDSVRIEAVHGLAEKLVSGKVVPEAHVVSRTDLEPLGEPLKGLTELSLRVERDAGVPQDIEWVFDGEQLWIVQTRPITVVRGGHVPDDGYDTPPMSTGTRYSTEAIAEMLPDVLPPLLWEVNSWLFEEAFRRVLDELGALPDGIEERHAFLRRVRGRAALNTDLLTSVAGRMPGGSEEEFERQYFGDPTVRSAPVPTKQRFGPRSVLHDLRVASTRRRAIRDSEITIRAARSIVEQLPPLPDLDAEQLLSLRRRVLDLAARTATAELGVAAAAVASYRRLELLLLPHLGEKEAGRQAQLLTARTGGFELSSDAASMAYFGGPTWQEAAVIRLDVTGASGGDREEVRRALEASLRARTSWRTTRILTGQVVDVRMHILRRVIDDAAQLLMRRERTKQALLELGGVIRRIHLDAGRRLVDAGVLDAAGDIAYLGEGEFERALLGEAIAPSEIERRRRCSIRFEQDGALPQVFTGTPEAPKSPAPAGDRFSGWGASSGRHSGRARVMSSPRDPGFKRGDVLVARSTDGSWSPLFVLAGAVVVEQGGPLSHAAIIARELGLPAVVNIPGITARLRDVDAEVTVDGDEGLVIVHALREDIPSRAAQEVMV